MIRSVVVVFALSFSLTACESWNLGQWKRVSASSKGKPATWVYVPPGGKSNRVRIAAPVAPLPIPEPVSAPAPLPQPEPEPVAAPATEPAPQPAAVTTGGQNGEPKVITCTIC